MTGLRASLTLILILGLAGCDNRPNKDFAQQMKERDAGNAGDRYVSLENEMPRLASYVQLEEQPRRNYAVELSENFRKVYDGMLAQLDGDKKIDHASGPFRACRTSFADASAWTKLNGEDVAAATAVRRERVAALAACRGNAKSAGDQGTLLARFASTGMVMIGAAAAGAGDGDGGLKIWREGEAFVGQDRPAFKMEIKRIQAL